MEHFPWLIPLGFAVGVFGTLIGIGGGFALVPILLLAYPNDSPEVITSISLAVVFFNALSGSIAYARQKRIDYKSGLLLSAASIPGAVAGALTTSHIPHHVFNLAFGVLLIGASVFLLFRANHRGDGKVLDLPHHLTRTVTEANGTRHTYSYNPVVGVALSVFVGFVSSLLGIGGGIIHVPAMTGLLNFPVHIATATSHFVLAIMSLTGTGVHIATGTFSHGIRRTAALAIGVVIGAQLGALLSNRVKGTWIIRGLALALAAVGIRLLIFAF